MGILNSISTPADLKALNDEDLDALAKEIRTFLVDKVAATGGHLGPNLGVVELTIGLHRVFDSPQDPIIFDTSHQSYVHKILTGRAKDFDSLRQKDGLSGYTCRAESEHDWTESSHASAALSYADGLSKAKQLDGDTTHSVVAVVGDGALTGGMCWEALNNIAAGKDRKVVVVVNDNGRSYSPTIGGFAENLAGLRMQPFYDRFMEKGKTSLKSMGWVGERTFEALHAFKEGVKSTVIPTEMFPELGMKYVGPVDGHNQKAVDNALKYAHDYDGPIIVHMVTEKGRGYAPAEQDLDELMHSTGVIDPLTGAPKSASKPGWTSVFSDELVKIGAQNENVVAITAAMAGPTGLSKFEANFPNRFFDVGIAEQHAVTSAAGLALGGKHPVVAIYSTFLNRAFDQLLMDVGMLNQPVTLVLDRSGVTGSDGASHNGVWDMALTSIVPGVQVAAPRDEDSLRELLNEAISIDDGPTVVRFPKGDLPTPIVAIDTLEDGVDVLAYEDATEDDAPSVLIVAVGERATVALEVASRIKQHGVNVTVVDPRWIVPIPQSLVALSDDHDLVITIEDGVIHGGVGSLLSDALNASEVDTPRRQIAVPQKYLDHASRSEVFADYGLDADGIETTVVGWLDSLFGE
ncbi:1-deoxy-D-xylulose-5-phosphate synthase [Corynebacterium glutamicum MT]|uniref:1-deoxy-D-xylulose-5-phosphate synthase n=1 Tax=Corynebacterium glutamicum TaxID=1718 RepID=A0AB36IJ06_CORGT|nr:1-deoxy-D-xylulose-5-phosphate synthase [Corynebacterium glutamicum]AGN19412.1 1-deoxy-D-xylulose-5-phosphate synthase [Corynebacterium glutamicum SCgG1]AGN22437.1 1-deoxy-D-xylulose-5-phosphate synthase [Corynebacterium glutamicum SCgG2]EGV39718.1 1-deoxy-D-xylulose-5-phosphate synthase [Corynebacterium glutamicum S9114]EOA64335.1 1-deoxy-D-xylulose-5-phosphate synthase [Corynebacterium glutamicum MT]EPP40349.1 1-deoxy-D-xylulose-5-phosphate synthase [Corynebacterium glutamicum Z188]